MVVDHQHLQQQLRHRKLHYAVVIVALCLFTLIQYTFTMHRDVEHNAVRLKATSRSVSTSSNITGSEDVKHDIKNRTVWHVKPTPRPPWTSSNNSAESRTSTSVVTTSAPRPRAEARGRLYVCGWTFEMHARLMFPDFQYVGRWEPPKQTMPFQRPQSLSSSSSEREREREQVLRSQPYTDQDLLVFGMHGPCANIPGQYPVLRLINYFPGKILFINGENFGSMQQPKQGQGSSVSSTKTATKQVTRPTLGPVLEIPTSSPDPYERIYQIGPYPPRLQLRNSLQIYNGMLWSTTFFVSWQKQQDQNDNMQLWRNGNTITTITDDRSGTFMQNDDDTLVPSTSSPWLWLVDPSKRRRNTGAMGNAVVYLTTNCVTFRQNAARRIRDEVGLPVHTGPKCRFDDGGYNSSSSSLVPSELLTSRKSYSSNYEVLFHQYKYCLVMENDAVQGYITEKIIMAFLGGCVPIYYGTEDVFDIFNHDAFVFYNISKGRQPEQPHVADALERIRQLESNITFYNNMLSVPILKDGQDTINNYFSILPGIGDETLYIKIRAMMGL